MIYVIGYPIVGLLFPLSFALVGGKSNWVGWVQWMLFWPLLIIMLGIMRTFGYRITVKK